LIAVSSFGLTLLVDQRNGQLDRNKRLRAAELRRVFTRLGPTFVKIGQGLSTRPDICPPEYLEELSELQVCSSLSIISLSRSLFICIELNSLATRKVKAPAQVTPLSTDTIPTQIAIPPLL
jgi:hypothetical protein